MSTTFTKKVYKITCQIPKGKVATYGQIAKLAGSQGAARAVGGLMARNPDAPHTPCHRVVASDGSLHGYSGEGEIKTKKQILLSEGVKFKGEKVDLEKCGWKFR